MICLDQRAGAFYNPDQKCIPVAWEACSILVVEVCSVLLFQ